MTLKEMFQSCPQPRINVEILVVGGNRKYINVRTIAEQNEYSAYQVMSWTYNTVKNEYQVYVKEI